MASLNCGGSIWKGYTHEFGDIHMSQQQSKRSSRIKSGFIVVGIVFILLVVILLIPFVFKDEPRASLRGPDLSEIEYTEIFFLIMVIYN